MFDLADKMEIRSSITDIKSKIRDINDKLNTLTIPEVDVSGLVIKLNNIDNKLNSIEKSQINNTELADISRNVGELQSLLTTNIYPILSNIQPQQDLSMFFNSMNSTIINTADQTVSELNKNITKSREISSKIDSIYTLIDTIHNSVENINNIQIINKTMCNNTVISYPTSGTATLTSGNTIFDFREGIVRYPNNSEYNMSNSSEQLDDIYIRSLTVFVDTPVDISLFGQTSNKISILAGTFRIKEIEITRLEIYTTQDTNVWIGGSTTNDGAPQISFSFGESDSIGMPNSIIVGEKTDISTTAEQITTTSTPINKVVTIKVRSLGTGTYIAIGNSSSQTFRLTSVGDSTDIDYIDNLNKLYISTDIGTTGEVEYIGG